MHFMAEASLSPQSTRSTESPYSIPESNNRLKVGWLNNNLSEHMLPNSAVGREEHYGFSTVRSTAA